jgi:hypothetical protein
VSPQENIHRTYLQQHCRPRNRPMISNKFSGYVAFNHYLVSFPKVAGVPSCWKYKLRLSARGTSSSSSDTTVSRISHLRAVSRSGSRYGSTNMTLMISVQTQTLKRNWCPLGRTAWGLPRAQRWLLVNTP